MFITYEDSSVKQGTTCLTLKNDDSISQRSSELFVSNDELFVSERKLACPPSVIITKIFVNQLQLIPNW